MKAKTSHIAVAAVCALLLGGLYFFSISQKQNADPVYDQVNYGEDTLDESNMNYPTEIDDDDLPPGQKSALPGQYVEYSASALTSGHTKKVLFFYASWCPTCRPADVAFEQNSSSIPDGMSLVRVNYNDPDTDAEEKALAQKYGVTYQHTFVQIDADGNAVHKWNGGDVDELLSNVK